jgi:uncharacterized protein (DUF427 family)
MTKAHYANLNKLNEQITVDFNGVVLAESNNVILLSEVYKDKEYPAVMYFPRTDVNIDLFSKVENMSTHCPIKGAASYYNLHVDGENIEQAAWSYEDTLPDSDNIKEYLAFDTSKFNPDFIST